VRDRQRQTTERGHIDGEEDVDDARAPPRPLGVDRDDAGVRMLAPVDGDVEHARQRDVGDVAAAPRDEPRVLAPAHPRPEQSLAHPLASSHAVPSRSTQ
jgi:hypothetical protein